MNCDYFFFRLCETADMVIAWVKPFECGSFPVRQFIKGSH